MDPKAQPRVRDMRMLGIRVSDDAALAFEVARVAYGHRSLQELLRPVLEAEAKRLETDPTVKVMLTAAQERRRRQ
jgi:hypothetical protein